MHVTAVGGEARSKRGQPGPQPQGHNAVSRRCHGVVGYRWQWQAEARHLPSPPARPHRRYPIGGNDADRSLHHQRVKFQTAIINCSHRRVNPHGHGVRHRRPVWQAGTRRSGAFIAPRSTLRLCPPILLRPRNEMILYTISLAILLI